MSLSAYQALIQELGVRLGVSDMNPDEEGYIALAFDDIELHLQYEPDDNVAVAFVRFPEVEVGRAAEIYGMLLAANLFWQGTDGATFSLDFDTGRVFLADRRSVATLTLPAMEQWLERFINVAEYWLNKLNTTNAGGPLFDDDDPTSPGSPFRPLEGSFA